MDGHEVFEWLLDAIESGHEAERRTILRFTEESLYDRFQRMLQAALPHHPKLRGIHPLGVIPAMICSLPETAEIPPLLRGKLALEKDEAVQLQALPSGSIVSERGIPWGVGHIGAPAAWSRATGYRVKVGVIDTGVDFRHPDLRHSLERGINLLHRMELPQDDNGHGTHIAGTIAAANQQHGMIGVAPRAQIHPVKAFDHNGTAYVSDIILGIEWCVRSGIDVVNMSFGMKTRSRSLYAAVNSAYRSGVLIVASSGNDGRTGSIDYPARYANTIAVGATTRAGRIAGFTNRSRMIDVYAPGERIVSAWLRGKHREMSGTSMATSHVTGAVALLLSLKPRLSPGQIKSIIQRSAIPLKNSKTPRSAGELSVTRMMKLAVQV
ncbi:S8 family peptidase [Cohnella panacarvi]|uniref:S8 family peptidase n=1 Tax=Cohnella panacarvi TaxID=400776 RepID=UPI00047E7E24|nr:S8 family peptidase [Cohnella panacarvi]